LCGGCHSANETRASPAVTSASIRAPLSPRPAAKIAVARNEAIPRMQPANSSLATNSMAFESCRCQCAQEELQHEAPEVAADGGSPRWEWKRRRWKLRPQRMANLIPVSFSHFFSLGHGCLSPWNGAAVKALGSVRFCPGSQGAALLGCADINLCSPPRPLMIQQYGRRHGACSVFDSSTSTTHGQRKTTVPSRQFLTRRSAVEHCLHEYLSWLAGSSLQPLDTKDKHVRLSCSGKTGPLWKFPEIGWRETIRNQKAT
jgi:hypothetical protein